MSEHIDIANFEHDWQPSPYTSPSGKFLYHCEWCGLFDPAPVKVQYEKRPCEHDKYVNSYEVRDGAVYATFR